MSATRLPLAQKRTEDEAAEKIAVASMMMSARHRSAKAAMAATESSTAESTRSAAPSREASAKTAASRKSAAETASRAAA